MQFLQVHGGTIEKNTMNHFVVVVRMDLVKDLVARDHHVSLALKMVVVDTLHPVVSNLFLPSESLVNLLEILETVQVLLPCVSLFFEVLLCYS